MSNLQQMHHYNGLLRYHSAPSSLLASLIDAEEQLAVTGDSATLATFAEIEFAQFLDDHLCNLVSESNSVLEPMSSSALAGNSDSQCPLLGDIQSSTNHGDHAKLQLEEERIMRFEEPHSGSTTNGLSPELLSSTLASGGLLGTTLAASCGSAPMKLDAFVDVSVKAHTSETKSTSSPAPALVAMNPASLLEAPTFQKAPLECHTLMAGIAVESFLLPSVYEPANLDNVKLASRGAHGGEIAQVQTVNVLHPSVKRTSGLLRQHSSPAEFFSHLSSDVAFPSKVLSAGKSSEEAKIGRGANQGTARMGALYSIGVHGQDFHNMHRAQSSESTSRSGEVPHNYTKVSSSRLTETEVLCKVSAKRGYATHPRSIAERVRRTKINEGIKKLQDLVPVTEKFANTVTMLDEAVEYIKHLQRQVQELSACRQHCARICHSEGNIDIEQ
ncbi:hypothetical protein GOP47_0019119 [Adiantum capillus-veneris]|uniref:BHLH domain-containing protein n=1 Tax=Adiantum capillus-veneris TaxID=13818 RepID=A0A9D4UF58_ADICA|nr:hypothetical protein GOP47_0018803 [Adiantum capillus-veneris]KAI5066495.1 hypothetical protein GOP47_0019119 [Adiantum capillus-veneris]